MCCDTLQAAVTDVQGSTIAKGMVKEVSAALKQLAFSHRSLHLWKIAAWSYAPACSVDNIAFLEQHLSKVAPTGRAKLKKCARDNDQGFAGGLSVLKGQRQQASAHPSCPVIPVTSAVLRRLYWFIG